MAYVPYEGYQSGATELTNRLQDILTRQAAQKRQAMVDAYDQQYKEAQLKNMQSEADYRQQQMQLANRKLQEEQIGKIIPGSELTPEQAQTATSIYGSQGVNKVAPTLASTQTASGGAMPGAPVAPPIGPIAPIAPSTPMVSKVNEATPEKTTFAGTPQYQENQKTAAMYGDLMADKSLTPEQKLLKLEQANIAGGGKPDLGSYERLITAKPPKKEGRRLIFNEAKNGFFDATGKQVTDVTTDDVISNLPRAPIGPQPAYIGTDETTGRAVSFSGGKSYTTDDSGRIVPYLGKMGAKPSAAREANKPLVSESAREQLGTLFGAGIAPESTPHSILGIPLPSSAPKAGDVEKSRVALNKARNVAATVVAGANTTQDVKDTITGFLRADEKLPAPPLVVDLAKLSLKRLRVENTSALQRLA